VALSYCWGQDPSRQPPKTTSKNIQLMYEEMKLSDFPQIFKDAIWMTRQLRVKYLWIDSICIIQKKSDIRDSEFRDEIHERDWAEESVKMKSYYGNAYLTLSVLDGKDSHTSMLSPRAEENTVRLKDCGLILGPYRRPWHQIFEDSILNSRGWVFQERLLSTRVLHSSSTEFLWECKSFSAMEGCSDTNPIPRQTGSRLTFPTRFPEHSQLKTYLHSLRPGNALEEWPSILSLYLRRNMTSRTDWLPGLSGLAEYSQKLGNLTYIAGIWQEDPTTLLWQAHSDPENEKMNVQQAHDVYVAPSWSCKFRAFMDLSLPLERENSSAPCLNSSYVYRWI
jgi:hypothetical protein